MHGKGVSRAKGSFSRACKPCVLVMSCVISQELSILLLQTLCSYFNRQCTSSNANTLYFTNKHSWYNNILSKILWDLSPPSPLYLHFGGLQPSWQDLLLKIEEYQGLFIGHSVLTICQRSSIHQMPIVKINFVALEAKCCPRQRN